MKRNFYILLLHFTFAVVSTVASHQKGSFEPRLKFACLRIGNRFTGDSKVALGMLHSLCASNL